MMRTFTLGVIVSSLIVAVAYAAAAVHEVDQNKLQFSVSDLTIKKGDKVKFLNSDRAAHNIIVTDGGKIMNSGLQQPGEPFEMAFTKSGKFPVSCGIHPKMQMTVNVE